MDFAGVNYRSGKINDEFDELVNISHVDEDVLRRRPGFTKFSTTAWWTGVQFNGHLLVADIDSLTFKNIDLSSQVATTNGYATSATVGTFVPFANRVYYVDGTIAKAFETPTSVPRKAGIDAPVSDIGSPTPAGSGGKMTSGAHLFRYRYLNSTTTYFSNPSGSASITVVDNDKVTFTVGTDMVASADSQVDKIILECSPADAATFYQVGTCSNVGGATITMSLSDANLLYQTPSSLYGDDGHAPMPAFDHLVEHRGRMFGIKGTMISWSRGGRPESWDTVNYTRKIATVETTDAITGAVSFAGDLYIFTAHSTTRFTYVDDPGTGSFAKSPTITGLWNPRCLVSAEGMVLGFGPHGAWKLTAMNPERISTKVDPFLEANIVAVNAARFFSFYDKRDRSVTFMFTTGTDTFPQDGVTWSPRTGAWSVREYEHGLEACVQAYGEAYLATSNSYTWLMLPTAFDGMPSPISEFTTTTGSTTTQIHLTITPSSQFIGTHLRIGTEVQIITNIVGNIVTVAAAFSVAPVTGTLCQAASIYVKIARGWERIGPVGAKGRGVYLLFSWEPTTGGDFTFQHYLDFSATPTNWRKGYSDTAPTGVNWSDMATFATVSTDENSDGYAPVPLPSTNCRVIRPRISTYDLIQKIGILSFEYSGWDDAKRLPGVGE